MIVFLFIFYAYHSLQQDYIGCVFINILRNNDEKRGANQKIPLVMNDVAIQPSNIQIQSSKYITLFTILIFYFIEGLEGQGRAFAGLRKFLQPICILVFPENNPDDSV